MLHFELLTQLPSKVRERFVGFRHAERVFLLLDGRTLVVGREHKFCRELLGHRLTLAAACGDKYPAECERLLALRAHFARHLVVGAADAAGADFHGGADVADCGLEEFYRIFHLSLLFYDIKGIVDHFAGSRLLAVPHDGVDELFHAGGAELKVDSGNVAIFYWTTHIELFCFRGLGSVTGAGYAALIKTGGVELAAHYLITDVDVLHAAGAHNNDRVLLKIVSFSGDIGGDFLSVGEAHAGDFSDSRVRLPRRRGGYFGAHAALKGAGVEDGAVFERVETALESRRFRLVGEFLSSFADKL